MGEQNNRDVVERYARALVDKDWDTLTQLRHPDYVSELPQSGERIRGRANARAVDEHYPQTEEGSRSEQFTAAKTAGLSRPSGRCCVSREAATPTQLTSPPSTLAMFARGTTRRSSSSATRR